MAFNDSQKGRMENWLEKGELMNIEDEMVLNTDSIITQVY